MTRSERSAVQQTRGGGKRRAGREEKSPAILCKRRSVTEERDEGGELDRKRETRQR